MVKPGRPVNKMVKKGPVWLYEDGGGEECSAVVEVRDWVHEYEARNTERIN